MGGRAVICGVGVVQGRGSWACGFRQDVAGGRRSQGDGPKSGLRGSCRDGGPRWRGHLCGCRRRLGKTADCLADGGSK